ncbi:AAA family ATPase [Infirmifilum uzonense]|uniref:AAA family ATPase n=1 Tax=Infirmifilum uzonense TaxID=1550241 RepID=UPI00069CBDC6|nr:AAA family ATPase [Infirmifilum uzonense]
MEDILEKLKGLGLGPTLIGKLKAQGLLSESGMRFIIASTPDELIELLGLSGYDVAQRLRQAAKSVVGFDNRAVTAAELLELEEAGPRLTTGVKALDELLGGGLRPGDLYEFAGEFGTGKTQLCHQLSVMVQLPAEKGGLQGKAVYIDTEGTFSPPRVQKIAERFNIDGTEALKSITVYRPLNTGELESFVKGQLNSYLEAGARLVIVDSVIALYRAQYRGIEWLARRQQAINYLLDWVKRWARVYGAVAVITNQVLTHPLPSGIALKIPAGGNIIAHASTHRFLLKKTGDAFLLEVLDSPRVARGASVEFRIEEDGLHDAR